MRVVIQRVNKASVTVNNNVISQINRGFLLLVGIQTGDTISCISKLVPKIVKLKLFSDPNDINSRWKQSLLDVQDSNVLAVSQFTLFADTSKGSKPDFHRAMNGNEARLLFDEFVKELGKALGSAERVKVGAFGEYMQVNLENDGPVTITLDTNE